VREVLVSEEEDIEGERESIEEEEVTKNMIS
jgi:hypothetical protein